MENSKRARGHQRQTKRNKRTQPTYSRRAYREMVRITQAILNYLQFSTQEVQHGHSHF